jgi:hypothetical protein
MGKKNQKPKPTRKEILQAMRGMMGKAMELGWSPHQTEEESREAMEKPKFVYCKMSRIWGPWKRGKRGNDGGFIVAWGAEKVGFGELSVCCKNGRMYADTEGMGAPFARLVLWNLFKNVTTFDPKRK